MSLSLLLSHLPVLQLSLAQLLWPCRRSQVDNVNSVPPLGADAPAGADQALHQRSEEEVSHITCVCVWGGGGQCVLMYLGPFKNTTHCIELPTQLMVCERMSMYVCTYMSVFQRCCGSTVIRSTVAEVLLSESIVEVSSFKRCRPKCLW